MPSKSDIQFGKIVVANNFATKDEVEKALRLQYRFEKKKEQTAVIEPFLLNVSTIEVTQIKAIQDKVNRRVIFCEKCSSKFNISQFTGGEKFLCHKCGNRVRVPHFEEYSSWLTDFQESVGSFLRDEDDLDATAPGIPGLEEEATRTEKQTILISRSEIETPGEDSETGELEEPDEAGEPELDLPELELEPDEVPEPEPPPEKKKKKKKKKKKDAKEIAKKLKKKKGAGKPADDDSGSAALVYTMDKGTLSVTDGSEKSFLSEAPKQLEDLFAGRSCVIRLSEFGGLTRDCIKTIRSIYKDKKSKTKVTLEITKDQEKLAGSMTKKMFKVKLK
jgi:hypothetical protein